MRIYEVATHVKVMDNERSYYYWVKLSNPERAKRAAIKKHCSMMGMSPHEREFSATIITDKKSETDDTD